MLEQMMRRATALVAALAGAVLIITTLVVWAPCAAGMYSAGCLAAMEDGIAMRFAGSTWILVLVIALVAAIVRSTRAAGLSALLLLLVVNPFVDMALFQALSPLISGETAWDLPVLTGLLTGVVLLAAAAMLLLVRWRSAPVERVVTA